MEGLLATCGDPAHKTSVCQTLIPLSVHLPPPHLAAVPFFSPSRRLSPSMAAPAPAPAPQRPITRMTSRCTAAATRATLVFQIAGYSMHEGLGVGRFLQSAISSIGGFEWCVRYFPDGQSRVIDGSEDHVAVFVALLTKGVQVRALYDFRLVNMVTGQSSAVFQPSKVATVFSSLETVKAASWGYNKFMKRSELQKSEYLMHDRLVIECDITVIKDPIVTKVSLTSDLQVLPSELSGNLGKFLETEEEADVTFDVSGEIFQAHKIVLAMRSPVFKAQLYGPMRDTGTENITVEDMQPVVFKALLHFIYRDSLPSMDEFDADENSEMIKHLVVAADRYGMERMKKICEAILYRSLRVENVIEKLALADQHHCSKLKDACINFITTLPRMDDVLASQGYLQLKRSCPAVIVDMLEMIAKSRRM